MALFFYYGNHIFKYIQIFQNNQLHKVNVECVIIRIDGGTNLLI